MPSRYPGSGTRFGASTARPRRSCGCGRAGCAPRASAWPASCGSEAGAAVARVRQAPLGREAGVQARIGAGPGGAQVRGRRPQRGAVRGHHLREDPPGLAVSGARDGHMVAAHRGMVDGPEHRGRARRRGIEDSVGQAKPARGMRSSQRLSRVCC